MKPIVDDDKKNPKKKFNKFSKFAKKDKFVRSDGPDDLKDADDEEDEENGKSFTSEPIDKIKGKKKKPFSKDKDDDEDEPADEREVTDKHYVKPGEDSDETTDKDSHPYIDINPFDSEDANDPNPQGRTKARDSVEAKGAKGITNPYGMDTSDDDQKGEVSGKKPLSKSKKGKRKLAIVEGIRGSLVSAVRKNMMKRGKSTVSRGRSSSSSGHPMGLWRTFNNLYRSHLDWKKQKRQHDTKMDRMDKTDTPAEVRDPELAKDDAKNIKSIKKRFPDLAKGKKPPNLPVGFEGDVFNSKAGEKSRVKWREKVGDKTPVKKAERSEFGKKWDERQARDREAAKGRGREKVNKGHSDLGPERMNKAIRARKAELRSLRAGKKGKQYQDAKKKRDDAADEIKNPKPVVNKEPVKKVSSKKIKGVGARNLQRAKDNLNKEKAIKNARDDAERRYRHHSGEMDQAAPPKPKPGEGGSDAASKRFERSKKARQIRSTRSDLRDRVKWMKDRGHKLDEMYRIFLEATYYREGPMRTFNNIVRSWLDAKKDRRRDKLRQQSEAKRKNLNVKHHKHDAEVGKQLDAHKNKSVPDREDWWRDIKSKQDSGYKFNESLTMAESIALVGKAKQSGYKSSVIREVYNRGLYSWPGRSCNMNRKQYAFSRVNSFVAGGEARKMDDDLT